MTAYGAVSSLKNTIDYILHSSYFALFETSSTIIQTVYNELQPLQDILERLDDTRTSRSRKKVNELDGRIKERIWEFEDKLESLLYQQILPQFPADQELVDGNWNPFVILKSRRGRNRLHFSFDVEYQQILPQFPAADQVDGDGVREYKRSLLESLFYQQILPQFRDADQVDGDGDGGIKEITAKTRRLNMDASSSRSKRDGDGGIKETTICEYQGSLLESHIPSQFEFQGPPRDQVELITSKRRTRDPFLFSIDVDCLGYDVLCFIDALKDMKEEYIYELENMPQEPISTTIGFDFGPKVKMIGFFDVFQQIKGDIMKEDYGNFVHEIVGTAGIGKTTLAKEVYEDADIVRHFGCRAWVTVTRTMVDEGPQLDEVVNGIVAQLCDGDTPIQGDQDIADHLEGKICLIVLDDIWEQQVLDYLLSSMAEIKSELLFILVTTRGLNLIVDGKTEARFLTEEESKDLLCQKVFGGKELCPPQLDKAATKIAKKCEGLPLMIVTVADILWESQNTEPEYWSAVAEERNSVFTDAYNEISEVLYPSYDYLPQYLKMPFLYMGVFPTDYEIPQSKLMNMLNAEGWLLDSNKKDSLEGSLKGSVSACLNQLCSCRYLVLFKRKSVNWCHLDTVILDSIYKTCWLHSSWRFVCRGEARKNKLYHALHKLADAVEEEEEEELYHALHKLADAVEEEEEEEEEEEDIKGQRGLCLQNNVLFSIKKFRESVRLKCAFLARSLLLYGPYQQYSVPIDVGFGLLRELDALQLRFYTFPTEILTLVLLKYLALTCNGELPSTISKLFNLRILIVHPHVNIRRRRAPSYIPIQIWDMQELEHIEILGKNLVAPSCVASLKKLSTLVGVNASISTILELSGRIPKIRKMGVQVELTPYDDNNDLLSCFACISMLESLEILKFSIINPVMQHGYVVPVPPNSLKLPRQLKKLHLSGMGFPWEYMDTISSLPSLQVLKLRSYAFRGSNWEAPQVGKFQRLEFLLIEDSDLVRLRLPPNLYVVSIKHCYKLKKIQWRPSHRSLLPRKIELVDCNPLAFTWANELKPSGYSCCLDVTNSSSFEEKPKIINFKRYYRDRQHQHVGSRSR